jgi:hypothetical protein
MQRTWHWTHRGADKSLARPDWKKTIERSPFFIRRGGHCCRGGLVVRTASWIFFFLSDLRKLEFARYSLFPSWSGSGLISNPVNVQSVPSHLLSSAFSWLRITYPTTWPSRCPLISVLCRLTMRETLHHPILYWRHLDAANYRTEIATFSNLSLMSLRQHSDVTCAFRSVQPSQTKERSILRNRSLLVSFTIYIYIYIYIYTHTHTYYKSFSFLHCTCLYTWHYAWQSVAVSFVSM